MSKGEKTGSILRVVFSLGLIGLLLWVARDELVNALSVIRQADVSWFLAAFALNVVIMILLSQRMRIAFIAAGVEINLAEAIQLTFIGYFFNNFLPTSAGGDVVKAYYSSRLSNKTLASSSAVLADRVYGTYGMFLIASAGVLLVREEVQNNILVWAILLLTATLTVGLLFLPRIASLVVILARRLNRPWLSQHLEKLLQMGNSFALTSRYAVSAVLNSVFTKFLSVVGVYWLAIALDITVNFGTLLWLVQIAFAVSLLPSINGLGFREGAFVVFLGPVIGVGRALALAVLWLAVYIFTDVIGGIIYLFSANLRNGARAK